MESVKKDKTVKHNFGAYRKPDSGSQAGPQAQRYFSFFEKEVGKKVADENRDDIRENDIHFLGLFSAKTIPYGFFLRATAPISLIFSKAFFSVVQSKRIKR